MVPQIVLLCVYAPLILFDFAAAFPSIGHRFLLALLQWLRVPSGLLRLLKSFYSEAVGLGSSGRELFLILAGVLQGCPLSGSLFTLAVDGFLRAMQRLAGDEARVAACTDDIGVVVGDTGVLPPLARLFCRLEKLSLLALKPPKCIVVPLWPDIF